ncbi:ATP-binding protein [Bacillus sp. B1-b2]|uniref:ATP-binding protein n=1 Tax=Bacillus sp. B1-b2 TaxID=2653201 RepID=UPI001261AC97|nr:ATP-binding protein [Bacillus sp. B1-b2]KAB7672897.1 cell wall metabolism sensor histidine kinase WalK [Bacillus sp. B1-b2]
MKFWRSVVFKLWITFLLLVSVVLTILTIMLLEYFDETYKEQTAKSLSATALKISEVLIEQDKEIGLDISKELLDNSVGAFIVFPEKEIYTFSVSNLEDITLSTLQKNKEMTKSISNNESTVTSFDLGKEKEKAQQVAVAASPIGGNSSNGMVYVYQSNNSIDGSKVSTTKFIVLAAVVAIILTTIFAFFLLTRITAPLRSIREAALKLAQGDFDTKIPILSQDEIGELGVAFNEMARRLNFNMNALSQEKEQLNNILSGMADGVITFNKNGSLLITNPPAERFLQHWYYEQGEQVKDKSQIPNQLKELFQLAVTTGDEQIDEITLQGRNWVMIVSPLYNKENIRGAIVVIRDMTEERKLDKLRIDFIANVSHELRTPISMLQGYSEAIVDDIAESAEDKKELARIIYDESLRMGRLVNEFLDLARMEAGHLDLNKESIEVSSFINRVTRKFNALAREKEVEFSVLITGDTDYYEMDPDRMEQVLTNVMDNCIRHTNKGGAVSVRSKSDEYGVFIEIEDTGTGIPEEDLPYVFERFYKADKARTRGNYGTGLGLAIAKDIVEAHHGGISVHSKIGRGTTFFIFLPRNNE